MQQRLKDDGAEANSPAVPRLMLKRCREYEEEEEIKDVEERLKSLKLCSKMHPKRGRTGEDVEMSNDVS